MYEYAQLCGSFRWYNSNPYIKSVLLKEMYFVFDVKSYVKFLYVVLFLLFYKSL